MKLCSVTLCQYIDYHCRETQNCVVELYLTPQRAGSVYVTKDCSLLGRTQYMWTIGAHITYGLEFMHAHG